MMVEVFKTNIHNAAAAHALVRSIRQHTGCRRVDIDLEDCDKVLRVEGEGICAREITVLVTNAGFECTELE